MSKPILGCYDLFAGLKGAIAGLVSITAGPDIVEPHWVIIIGAVGGVLCTAGIRLLEIVKVDDVIGAGPAHLVVGMWGTMAVCIVAGGNLVAMKRRRSSQTHMNTGDSREFASCLGAGSKVGRSESSVQRDHVGT
ncbi:MAG: hypothetical protein OXM00_05435 [Paracoccaceae bacterium]|nr:hypothetical protein [Paracoccaceae bacterium]